MTNKLTLHNKSLVAFRNQIKGKEVVMMGIGMLSICFLGLFFVIRGALNLIGIKGS